MALLIEVVDPFKELWTLDNFDPLLLDSDGLHSSTRP